MKKLVYVFVLLTLSISCKKEPVANQHSNKTDDISDPNVFIGMYKAKAMILGVFHFRNSGLDSYKPAFPFNILEEKRQSELNILLEKITAYKPTKIVLEWNRIKHDSIANIRYQKFVKDSFDISNKANEVYQIGFQLAKKLGHTKIYCSDAAAPWFGVNLDWGNYDTNAYLKEKGQYKKMSRYKYTPFYRLSDSLKTKQTLVAHLTMINNPSNRLKDHQAYLTSILEGAGDNYLGADAVAKWYRRNLRIFSNVYDVVNFNEEERVLLIYGAGHVWQLRQLFKDSPDFDYIEPNKYLTK